MPILGFELEEIARYIALVEQRGLDELIIEEEGRYLRLRGPRRQKAVSVAAPAAPAHGPSAPPARSVRAIEPPVADSLAEDAIALESPMVGIFYRAGKPGDPPFIDVGQPVALNQTIGVIEAMKIFSEIPAEAAGIVIAIPAVDGQLVQAGTPLVILGRE